MTPNIQQAVSLGNLCQPGYSTFIDQPSIITNFSSAPPFAGKVHPSFTPDIAAEEEEEEKKEKERLRAMASSNQMPPVKMSTGKWPESGVDIDPNCLVIKDPDAAWFVRGRVFEVHDSTSGHINHRTMIVVAPNTCHDSIVCLALCDHPDVQDYDGRFWSTHMRAYNAEGRKPCGSIPETGIQNAIRVQLAKKVKLKPNTFTNVTHPYTIKRHGLHVVNCGTLSSKSDILELVGIHQEKYNGLLGKE